MGPIKNITKEQAVRLAESKFWEKMSFAERAKFQMFTPCLCMPFDAFHEAVEKALGRPVFTHEFGLNVEGLKKELLGEGSPPSLEDIINMIPAEKRLIVLT